MRTIFAALALLLTLAAACGGGDASTPSLTATAPAVTRTPKPTLKPSPSPSPTPQPTPQPAASIDLTGSQPRQGGFLVVRLLYPPAGLPDATVYLDGVAYPMLSDTGHLYGMIGIPTWFTVGDYPLEVDSSDGSVWSASVSIGDGGFQYENIEVPPQTAALLTDTARIDAERARVDQVLAGFTQQRYWSGPWIQPAEGIVSNPFGLQRSFNGGPYSPHTGTDLANAEGTPIYASATGVVAMAETLFLYGNSVIIDHGAGVFSSYNHMQSIVVAPGQAVNRGDLIGYMGQTGFADGAHVHWEAIVHGVRVDPMLWTQAAVEP